MSRSVALMIDGAFTLRDMPEAHESVMPGVEWGEPWEVFTPAYWLAQSWMKGLGTLSSSYYRAKDTVVEELGFCLLGGFGITAEMATATFEVCREQGLFATREISVDRWHSVLDGRFKMGNREVRYRYPNQKAKFLANAMQFVRDNTLLTHSGRALRDQLLRINGVGYKTASWVARNCLDSDDVAILDIHLIRAGMLCGLFNANHRVEKHYLEMEERFLTFSQALELRPAALDCVIWDEMREVGDLPLKLLRGEPVFSEFKDVSGQQLALLS